MNLDFQSFAEQGEWVFLLQRQIRENTLAHALLITGEEGVGKKTLADLLAAALLCRDPDLAPCGECRSCSQLRLNAHPDLIRIQKGKPIAPTESKTVIPVTDIIELETRCASHPFEGDRRVIIISGAEDMNIQAQNKLLKTLEEPSEGTFFLLTCEKKDRVLPTILSRCMSVYMHPWRRETVIRILKEEGVPENKAKAAAEETSGSIGKALKLCADETYWKNRKEIYEAFFHLKKRSDILSVSNQWKDRREDAEILLSTIESGIIRLLDVRLLGKVNDPPDEIAELYDSSWLLFLKNSDLSSFSGLLDGVALARRRLQSSVNFQVIVEQLLFLLMEANNKWLT